MRPDARFIRWFFSTGSDRTIFPASNVKVAEWVDNALLTNPNLTEEWLRNALIFLPDHPLLHIALAGFETDSKRADFLRSFGLARLPKNSVVCTRAGEMLLAQHRPELALAAVDKALLAIQRTYQLSSLRLRIQDAMAHDSSRAVEAFRHRSEMLSQRLHIVNQLSTIKFSCVEMQLRVFCTVWFPESVFRSTFLTLLLRSIWRSLA